MALGKLFGGTVGFMFGGPLGMIAGIAFGHMFDKAGEVGTEGNQRTQFNAYTSSTASGCSSSSGLFDACTYCATADGSVSSHERRKVVEFIRQDLRLGLVRKAALRVFDAALTGGGTLEQFATRFYQNFSQCSEYPAADDRYLLSGGCR